MNTNTKSQPISGRDIPNTDYRLLNTDFRLLMMSRCLCIILLYATQVKGQPFYFGVDLSYVNEMEDCGAMFNVEGIPADLYTIFKDNGANIVRLRLWHTPSWYDDLNSGNRYSDFDDVRLAIMRAKAEGLQVLLDFHLSDNWADPSKQVAPAAWHPVLDNLPVLQDSLYNYIYSTLNQLAVQNLLPELVQIGNETNKGILQSQEDNDSGWKLDWDRNAPLFNSAIAAIREIESDYQTEIKIAIHIADPSAVPWYIEQFIDHNVIDFDIIGMSYYWQWHDDTFEETGNVIASLKNSYPEKEVMILETAYPWTTINADGANNLLAEIYPGYSPFSPANQKEWMIDLTQTVIDNGGTGVFYWEPAWVSTDCWSQWAKGSSWDNATFFNADHELIEEGGIKWLTFPYENISSIHDDLMAQYQFEIVQSGNNIWIQTTNPEWKSVPLEIEFYSLDGKSVWQQNIYPVWVGQRCDIEIPDLTFNAYLMVVFLHGELMGSGIIVKN